MKKLLTAVLIVAMVFTLVGCGGKSDSKSDSNVASDNGPKGKVMLYSSMQEAQIQAIQEGFEKKYPGIKMDYYFAGTGKVITKIATEKQGGGVAADVIWVGDPADYVGFKEQGILQQYTSPETAHIASNFIDADGYYTGARMMNMGIAYSTVKVKPEEAPRTWKDLLDPKWNSQIVMTDPGSAGTTKFTVCALMNNPEYGEQFFIDLKNNGTELESGTTATHNKVAQGAYKVGICLDYVTNNLVNEGSPIAFQYLDNDIVSMYSPIGLVANCANEENGKLLYDYILSKEGQEILVKNNLLSVRDDVKQAEGVDVQYISDHALKIDIEKQAAAKNTILDKFDKIYK